MSDFVAYGVPIDMMKKQKLFITRDRKRIWELGYEDCRDAETFDYNGQPIWNGF